jgi:transcriptional regulator with XRE-family HTH domain
VTGPRLEGRNGELWRGWISGTSQDALAERFGISQQRVSQIIAEIRKSIPEPQKEELWCREMDFLDRLRVKAMELVDSDLPPVFSNRGHILCDENGEVVRDSSGRLAAINAAVKLHERVARMAGIDAPTRTDLSIGSVQQAVAERAAEALARIDLLGGE